MKGNKWLLLICISLAIFMLVPLGLAYFEYIANYDVLINGDGTINQNAFGVLNSESYRDPQYNYGTSPENPFVIDNLDRLYNLIRLNNTGRLVKSKKSGDVYEIPQYYFVLDFTKEKLPQVLNLNGIVTASVGNNEFPFVDKLSGLIYAYCYDDSSYIYLSGLINPVEVVVNQSTGVVTIDGVATEVMGSSVASGKYIKVPSMYVEFAGDDKITAGSNVYVPLTSLKPIHNVIANATVEVPDEQVDVGFFNTIAAETVTTSNGSVPVQGSVSNVIFYNLTVNCIETAENNVMTALASVWSSIFGSHNFETTYTYDPVNNVYYERHIGLFAGHIDGAAANITVAGNCNIHINSKDVNYYSAFTTVGYIDNSAVIGGIPYSELLSSGENVADITGCMFADSIYAVAENDPNSSSYMQISGGLTRYLLSSIPASGTWKGVSDTTNGHDKSFSYGSFHFILSDGNDTVSKIWSGQSTVNLLNTEGYVASQSVLYCNDEYRYSSSAQSGGSLVAGAASANETQYQGIHTLIASGSTLDKGKYIICAKIPTTLDGVTVYHYYALKIIAEVTAGNQIVYSFDNSEKCDITDYINDTSGNTNIYSSALWQTSQDSSTPTFRNTRFDTQYLTVNIAGSSVTKELTTSSASAAKFRCSVLDSTFTYTVTQTTENGIVSTNYYLNYNTTDGFYFSTVKNTVIELYRLSNGFGIELVDSVGDLTGYDDYLIVGKDGTSYYLLGERILEEAGSTTVTATGTFCADYKFTSMPTLWSMQEYQNFRQYIWYAKSAAVSGGTASLLFSEKVSGTYYLNNSEGQLSMTPAVPAYQWVYTQGSSGGTLSNNMFYLSFNYVSPTETNFSLGSSASTIYIYKIVPRDEDPKYTTYLGANLVTSDSSSVEKAQYLISADIGTELSPSFRALTLDVNGNIMSTDVTAFLTGSAVMDPPTDIGDTYGLYKWSVDTTSTTPVLRNSGLNSCLSASGTALSISGSGTNWRYNAGSERLYYETTAGGSTVRYYLCYNTSAGCFALTEGMLSGGNYDYDIGLYKVIYTYTYVNVTEVSSLTAGHSYMIATQPLDNLATTASYAIGSESTLLGSDPKSLPLTPSTTSYSGTTLITTVDLSYYKWKYSYDANYWNIFTNFKNNGLNGTTATYLSVSSAGGTRTFAITTILNNAQNSSYYNSSYPVTHFEYADRTVGGSIIKFRGTSYYYYLYSAPVPGFVKIYNGGSNGTYTNYYIYLYDLSNYSTSVGFELLSKKGDNLEPNSHYMITVRTGGESDPLAQYYALSESVGDDGNLYLTGINVTSQAEAINNSYVVLGEETQYHSTDAQIMVPLDSDWFQTSSTKALHFYHSEYSTDAVRSYLDVSSTDSTRIKLTEIPTGSSLTSVDWYYDEVNHYFKYYIGSTAYYLAYDRNTDTFSLTTEQSSAAPVFVYRFKPTYIITQVTSLADDSLKNGYFIISAKDSTTNQYIALGMNNTSITAENITSYLNNVNASTGNIEMTETQYEELLQFIWYQRYYDYYSSTYNSSGTSATLLLFSQYATGGFVANSSTEGFGPASYPMEWLATSASGGTWTIKNNEVNGSITVGSRGILYNGLTSYLQIGDGYITNGSYLRSNAAFSTSGSNFYLCDLNGNIITSTADLNSSSSYIIRGTSGGVAFMVKNSGGTISLVPYNPGNTSDCLWNASLAPGGFILKSGSYYAAANSSAAITASTTSSGIWYFGSGGLLAYASMKIPYRSSRTAISFTTNAGQYWAKLYKYTYKEGVTTLSPATSIITSDSYMLVMYNGSAYYAAYAYSNTAFRPYQISPTVSGDNLIISGQLSNYSYYLLSASTNGSYYRFYNTQRGRYLYTDGSTISASTSTSSYFWSVDSFGYFYYGIGVTSYTPKLQYTGIGASSSGNLEIYFYIKNGADYIPLTGELSPGNKYAVVVYNQSTYNIIGHTGTSLSEASLGASLPSSLTTAQVTSDRQFTSVSSECGVYLYAESAEYYMNVSGSEIVFSASQSTEWRYSYSGLSLYTVSKTTVPTSYITRGSLSGGVYSIAMTSTATQTYIYTAVPAAGGGYTLRPISSALLTAGKDIIIAIYYSGSYYAVQHSAGAVNAVQLTLSGGAIDGSSVTSNMVWHYDGTCFTFDDQGTTKYLRKNESGLYLDTASGFFTAKYTTTAFTATSSTSSNYYIYKVEMSDELDMVTDTDTMLSSRVKLTASISLLESSRYVIVAEVDRNADATVDKYYSLGMIDANNSQSIDITDIIKKAAGGGAVTLFDTCVWEQKGSDLSLIFDNCGFEDTYYLTGVLGNRDSMEPKVVHPETPPTDFSDFIWRTYSFEDGSYLFGYTEVSGAVEQIYYLYFDTTELVFKLTSSVTTARNSLCVVQLYQLGAETANQPYFETPVIQTENNIIISYPLNLTESKADLKKYAVLDPGGTGVTAVQGEYLIIAVSGVHYYALTLDSYGALSYVDVSPYFSGNYSYDDNDNLCLAVNYNYIWRQMNDVSELMNVPSLSFCNSMTGAYLGGMAADVRYDFDTRTLSYTSGTTMRYLNFCVENGFTFDSTSSGYQIMIYSLGAHGTDTGDTGTLNYTYYSTPLSTSLNSSVTFSNFEFNKKHMSELINYAVGTNGFIEKSIGWSLTSAGGKLSEINSSVFFTKGYTYDPSAPDTVLAFSEEFSQFVSPYNVYNQATGETIKGSFTYYAPSGTAAFVIDEASSAAPVFVNIVVSTQFDIESSLDENYLRYLALWRVANLSFTSGTATALNTYNGGDGTGVLDYAYTFEQKLRKPDFAIPLPNKYGSASSGASYAYVDGQGYVLSDAAYGEDYLIAHTFVISEPGVYYLGATYGSVAICYISIDNMAEGEATGGVGFGSDFSIDFCYGEIELSETAVFDASLSDELLNNLTYVGKDDWYHSNIFPMFISGSSSNMTDMLDINVVRVLNKLNNTSSVNVIAHTKARIAKDILYINNNSISQRAVRKVSFNVFCDGLAAGVYLGDSTVFWTASKDESAERYRLYSKYIFNDNLACSFFLNADSEGPSLSAAGVFYWTCDAGGRLVTDDGRYLIYSGGIYSLSPVPTDGCIYVYRYEGGTPTLSTSMTNGGTYFLITTGANMIVIRPD